MKKKNIDQNEEIKPQNEEEEIDVAEEVDTANEGEEDDEDIVFSPEIEAILADYRAELEELYENRRKRSIIRSQMTEEQLIASMEIDLLDVYNDALENGMDVVTIGDSEFSINLLDEEDEEEESSDGDGDDEEPKDED